MNQKVYKKIGRAPTHPGLVLKHGFIEQHDLRIETVANLLGIARGHLSRIINGRTPITPDLAIKLEVLTKTPISQWLALQADYDSYAMEQKTDFKEYRKTINTWLSDSLPLIPKKRRCDQKTKELVETASELAHHFNRKSKTV